jgi:hypothetical protein
LVLADVGEHSFEFGAAGHRGAGLSGLDELFDDDGPGVLGGFADRFALGGMEKPSARPPLVACSFVETRR